MSTEKRADISHSGVKFYFYFQTNRKFATDMSMSDGYVI
jgi:hypothetical protein